MPDPIINKILEKLEQPELVDILASKLTLSELQSFLLEIYQQKTSKLEAKKLLEEYKSNRFVKPSDLDPKQCMYFDQQVFKLLPEGFQPLELSPLTPLGTSSVVAPVHQNNVVTTIRNTEVVADSTNCLTLECARRRQELLLRSPKSTQEIKLCASHRVTRGQAFDDPNYTAHFKLLALCTAGRDTGSNQFEQQALAEHVAFYLRIINELLNEEAIKKITIRLFNYADQDNSSLFSVVGKLIKGKPKIDLEVDPESSFGKGYYRRLRFMIRIRNHQDQAYDYVDGGFTDWTSKLLSNNKERLLTSGLGVELLLKTLSLKKTI